MAERYIKESDFQKIIDQFRTELETNLHTIKEDVSVPISQIYRTELHLLNRIVTYTDLHADHQYFEKDEEQERT